MQVGGPRLAGECWWQCRDGLQRGEQAPFAIEGEHINRRIELVQQIVKARVCAEPQVARACRAMRRVGRGHIRREPAAAGVETILQHDAAAQAGRQHMAVGRRRDDGVGMGRGFQDLLRGPCDALRVVRTDSEIRWPAQEALKRCRPLRSVVM